jgi:putative ABC transport system permease protein
MQHTDLGFTIENTINIQPLGEFSESYDAYRNELIKSPYILDVSAKNCLPTDWNNGNAVSIPGSDAEPYLMEVCWAKDNYFDMMDIEIIEGDPITLENSKQEYVWLNEQALKVLNLEDPIGKTVLINESPTTIKGIFENVKSKSLHIKVDPQVYQPMYNVYPYYQLFIRTNGDVREALKDIETQWDKAIPGEIFEYTFLDQTYHNLYTAEVRAGKIVTWGMGIALFLTLIGLFAMATYSAERRTKEIGIRKVNGARITEILTLLNKEFLKYILISCVLAIPISWYLMNNWLENFAFRTNLSWWIFGLASVIVMVISIITVTWQSWKSARKNPVEALRYE